MNIQERISELQMRRHRLLDRRTERDVRVDSIDMELNVVRSELLALYQIQHKNHQPQIAS